MTIFKGHSVPEQREVPELLGYSILTLQRLRQPRRSTGQRTRSLAPNPAHSVPSGNQGPQTVPSLAAVVERADRRHLGGSVD